MKSPEIIYAFERKMISFIDSRRKEIKVKVPDNPSVSEGIKLDKNGDWEDALKHFIGVYRDHEGDFSERVDGALWASQMLTNMGRLNQAEGILDAAESILKGKEGKNSALLKARIFEKRAWVADYRGDYVKEIKFLYGAKEIYDSFGDSLPLEFEDSHSTVEHFFGRAKFGLAWQNKNKERNLDEAIGHFEKDLKRYQKLRNEDKPRSSQEGFNYLWLARCYGYKGDFSIAQENLENSIKLFNDGVKRGDSPATLAHYYLVSAELEILRGEPKVAIFAAEEALWIRINHKPKFPKGEIEALLVLGLAYWQDGRLSSAWVFGKKAFEVAKHLWDK